MKFEDRFKFRIWDVQNQKYHFFDLTKTTEIDNLAFFADGVAPDYNEQVKCPDSNCWALIIEQCTGLKDKNNNLIYEGDIVDYDGKYWKVFYSTATMEWGLMGDCYSIYGNKVNRIDTYQINCKIIGNIRQNPELLDD